MTSQLSILAFNFRLVIHIFFHYHLNTSLSTYQIILLHTIQIITYKISKHINIIQLAIPI